MDSFAEIWNVVLEEMKKDVTDVAFRVWLSPIEFNSFKDGTVYLEVSEFKRRIIIDKFSELIKNTLEEVLGFPVEVDFIKPEISEEEALAEKQNNSINYYNYTFANFIIGPSNRFAHAAASNVAKSPGAAYNPLFIYGHSGLGKTHLLLAIQNEIKERRPDANIIYTSGEHFTNELVYYIGNHNTHAFHDKYRSCDVLLVDDIQFISKGETTQEEFFHTFNELNSNGSQIVLTSDRPPKEMITLEERLRTRFEMGLIADIQPPTLETRIAIIKSKCNDIGITISDDVVNFLANNITKNIRQLEGTVLKMKAFYDVEGRKPDLMSAKAAIKDIINDKPVPVTIDNIINEVARTFSVTPADIRSEKRQSNISLARQVAIYIVEQVTELPLKTIGKEFGNKHHSTIIYALKEIKIKLDKDVVLKASVDDIIKNINEN